MTRKPWLSFTVAPAAVAASLRSLNQQAMSVVTFLPWIVTHCFSPAATVHCGPQMRCPLLSRLT